MPRIDPEPPSPWRSQRRTPHSSSEQSSEAHPADIDLVASVTQRRKVPTWQQWKYAARVFNVLERRILWLTLCIGILCLGTAGFLSYREFTTQVPAVGGTYVEGLVGQPRFLNPLDAPGNDVDRDLVHFLFSGLFEWHGTSTVPNLAESWKWSDDSLTLDVTVRQDRRFHDGNPITADDVAFTFQSAQNPDRGSPLASLYRGIDVQSDGDRTVQFTLSKADPAFLEKLTLGILPAHAWQDVPPGNALRSDLNQKPIGSGPYQLKRYTRDEQGNIHTYTLERTYPDHETPRIETVTFQFFPDKTQAYEALHSGLIDAFAFPHAEDVLKSTEKFTRASIQLPEETVVFFNIKDPLLSQVPIRTALLQSIHRDLLVKRLQSGLPIDGPYPFQGITSTSTAENATELAVQTLEKAGWTLPPGKKFREHAVTKSTPASTPTPKPTTSTTPTATTTPLTFTLSFPDDPTLVLVADELKIQWEAIGVELILEPQPLDLLLKKATREHATQITLVNLLLSPDENLFPFWWSGLSLDKGLNFSNISNKEIDDALDKLRTASTTESRNAAKTAVTHAIQKSQAAAFLFQPEHVYLLAHTVQGVPDKILAIDPSHRFANFDSWYIKTKRIWK